MLWWKKRQLKSSRWEVRAEAARQLGASRQSKALQPLIQALGDEHPGVRLEAIRAIGSIGHPGGVEPLARALASASRARKPRGSSSPNANAEEYEALAQSLARLGGSALAPLLRLLDSEDRGARRWAAHSLGQIKDTRAVDPLIRRLGDDRSDVRQAAAAALGQIGEQGAIKALTLALSNRDGETRRAAAEALGNIGAECAVPALISAVEDSNEHVQLAAVEGLRRIGGLNAGAGVRSALEGGKKTVREAAMAALKSMQFAPSSAEERARAAVLTGNFEAALREEQAATDALIEALGSRDSARRLQAASALASLRPERAIQALILALKDHDSGVQKAAAQALANIGLPASEPLLQALDMDDATVEKLAAQALGVIGAPEAAGALARTVVKNHDTSAAYLEPLEAARAAANAIERVLQKSPDRISRRDLEQIASVPDAIVTHPADDSGSLQPAGTAVDCSRIRELARLALARYPERK